MASLPSRPLDPHAPRDRWFAPFAPSQPLPSLAAPCDSGFLRVIHPLPLPPTLEPEPEGSVRPWRPSVRRLADSYPPYILLVMSVSVRAACSWTRTATPADAERRSIYSSLFDSFSSYTYRRHSHWKVAVVLFLVEAVSSIRSTIYDTDTTNVIQYNDQEMVNIRGKEKESAEANILCV